MFYSPSTNCAYPECLLDEYKSSGTLPPDIILISDEDYVTFFLLVPPPGCVRNYTPILGLHWIDYIPSPEERVRAERAWVKTELEKSKLEIDKLEDSDPCSRGTIEGWRNYRILLRAWESCPDFPNKDKRPSYIVE